MRAKLFVAAALLAVVPACQRDIKPAEVTASAGSSTGSGSGSGARPPRKPTVEQLPAPFDVKTPPADAIKTASGLAYKIITAVPGAAKPGRNDTVQVQYTGWRPSGETFYTTRTRGKPMPMPLNSTAPGFHEGLQLLGKGEKAMLWIPAEIGYRTKPAANAEALAYEVELIEIELAPPVPPDVAAPPPAAKKSASGVASLLLKAGTGADKPSRWDDVTYTYTSWDVDGKMLESTEMRKRPMTAAPFRQPEGIEEALTSMRAGERSRFWIPGPIARKSVPPAQGVFTFEIELTSFVKKPAPPPTPADVKAPPADATKTPSGLAYKQIKAGTGKAHPTATQAVKVHYTGWTTDGKLFESSILSGNPVEFALNGVIAGWTEGLQLMTVGERARLWIPEELAYKGSPGKPQGMLVFEIEMLAITEAPPRPQLPAGMGKPGGHGLPGLSGRPGGPTGGRTLPRPGGAPAMPGAPKPPPAPGTP